MAIHYDGENELRIFYTTLVGTLETQHRHTIDVKLTTVPFPGDALADLDVQLHNGGTSPLLSDVDVWVALMQPLFHTSSNITHVELWKYEAEALDGVFIGAEEIGLPGTAAVATQPAQQYTLTFRSAGGSIMRVQFMETVIAADVFQAVPWSSAAANAFRTLLTGQAHGYVARDDTRPIAGIRYAVSQNEKLYRKRFRPT